MTSNENLVNLFPISIYETYFPNFESIKQQLIADLEPHFKTLAPGNEYWTPEGRPMIYRTLPNLQTDEKFKPIIDFVEQHSRRYWEQLNLTKRVKPYVLHSWSNKIAPGGFTPVHVHTPIPIAAAFYVHANSEMGDLEIENPLDTVEKLMPRDNDLVPHFQTHTVKVEDGKLVLFPGWIRHFTRSNMTNDTRIIMSFNIGADITYHGKDH
jgi:uncharacterized protein (TIGR02466 family)